MFISSFSYAYWKYSDTQDLVNVVGTKCLQLTMHNETSGITITDAVPKSDEKGKSQDGYTFTIKNTCNTIAYYQINLEEIEESKRLEDNYIKVSLNESEGKLLSKYEEVNPTIKEENFTSDKSHKLTSDRLNPNEEKEYILKLWMDEETPAIEEVMNATFESKVSIIAVSKEEEELKNTITISYTEPEYYSKEIEEVEIHATSETYNLIEYSTDNKVWNSLEKEGTEETITQSYTKENTYPIYFKDEAGNIEEQEIETNKLDQTGPEISIEETSDNEGAVVNITFKDPKSGLQAYKIEDEVSRVDIEEGWKELTDKEQIVTYKSSVNKPIHITVKDKLENENTKDYDIIKADTKGPEIVLTNELKETWGTKDTIHISATDDISGVKEIEIQKDGTQVYTNTLEEPTKEYKKDYEVEENGTYKVIIKDALGNTSEEEITTDKIDVTPGTASFAIDSQTVGENNWKKALTIKVTTTDSESGITSAKYCVGTSNCEPNNTASISNGSFNVTFSNNASAQKVCVTVTNGANVTSDLICDSTTYKVDGALPTIESVTGVLSGTSINFTANNVADTGGSGLKTTNGYSFQIKEGTAAKTTVTSNTNIYNYTGGTRGKSYTATVTVTDNAGNPSAATTSNSVTIPIEKLEDIATTTSGDGLYSVPHSVSGTTNDTEFNKTELRYAGKDPSNYVTFNNEAAGWRIIGLVNTPQGQRIKLIKKAYYNTSIAWHSNSTNDWSKSSLQSTLNTTYYNEMTSDARNMIDASVTWNLGGSSTYKDVTTATFYTSERGTATIYTERPTTWTGKIGLMYPSDYGWATSGGNTTNRDACLNKELYNWESSSVSDCKNNDWLYDSSKYQWTLTWRSVDSGNVFRVCHDGSVSIGQARNNCGARPAVYLKNTVKISGGSGTASNPYTLSL